MDLIPYPHPCRNAISALARQGKIRLSSKCNGGRWVALVDEVVHNHDVEVAFSLDTSLGRGYLFDTLCASIFVCHCCVVYDLRGLGGAEADADDVDVCRSIDPDEGILIMMAAHERPGQLPVRVEIG